VVVSGLVSLPSLVVPAEEDDAVAAVTVAEVGAAVFLNLNLRSRIFLGLRHQSCSGLMQFQRTHGNHKAMPISMVRKMTSWVFRLVRSTLVFQNCSSVSENMNPTMMIIMMAWERRPNRDWCNWLVLTLGGSDADAVAIECVVSTGRP